MTATLLIDDEGSYDPRQLHNRFVLGMQGSKAAYELGLMRQRTRHAFGATIQRGQVMWEVPVGCVRTTDPSDAGALVYGRTATKTVLQDGCAQQTAHQKKPREPWRVLKLENHPGSLS